MCEQQKLLILVNCATVPSWLPAMICTHKVSHAVIIFNDVRLEHVVHNEKKINVIDDTADIIHENS